jgi:hypothetical protein
MGVDVGSVVSQCNAPRDEGCQAFAQPFSGKGSMTLYLADDASADVGKCKCQ